MIAINIFYVLIFFLYYVLILIVYYAWRKTKKIELDQNISPDSEILVSVIIAARNEEDNIGDLLDSLQKQTYKQFEVIIVDDHSQDNTYNIVKERISDFKQALHLFRLEEGVTSKKKALLKAISSAKGEYILCTDADCVVKENWIATFMQFSVQQEAKFVTAPVVFKDRIGADFLQTELSSLMTVTAATIFLNAPTMANAANMCYRKDVFDEVNGEGLYNNGASPSGDDEFLMHRIAEKYPQDIHFLKSKETIVSTEPPSTFTEFVNQRVRWASKWKLYEGLKPKILALLVFIFHFSQIILILFLWNSYFSWQLFIALLGFKISVESILLINALDFLNQGKSKRWIFLWSLIYPLYAVTIGMMGMKRSFYWKDRKYSK